MTSVGEEGLDIPQVDLVLFYEPIPSAVRSIQRRGRTGRLDEGSVIVLLAKGTRDEGYRWSSFHKEKRMHKLIKDLQRKRFIEPKETELTISQFQTIDNAEQPKEEVFVVAIDYREKNSLIVKELMNKNIKLELKKLDVGDYLLSNRVAIEYKRVPDFVDSIIDGRLLQQVKYLRQYYERPLIVVEGTEDLYSLRRINPTAIQGMLATITISYGVPIIYTKNAKETISLFGVIIKRESEREQDNGGKEFTMHPSKPMSLKEQQEYLVSALPGIGLTLAKPLLKHFRSVSNVFSASLEELQTIDLIGKKKAQDIRNVVDGEYFEWKKDD
jgi:Fanconi anemia group M protein